MIIQKLIQNRESNVDASQENGINNNNIMMSARGATWQ